MNDIVVNNLYMYAATPRGDGNNRISYCIRSLHGAVSKNVALPSLRVMRRLANGYLGCRLEQDTVSNSYFYFFIIDGGIKREKRAAFLAAVVANSKPVDN